MATVGMHEAKTQLSRLVEEALSGGDVVITRHGRPVARLVAVEPPGRSFADLFGSCPDLHVADDIDELPDDVARALGIID